MVTVLPKVDVVTTGMGGPGAVFWMWMIAFIGAATAYVESTLAQIYKEEKETEYRGGPAFYIEKGMGQKWFAIIFAIAALLAMLVLMPGVQSNAIAGAMNNAFGLEEWVTGAIIAVLLAVIIIGGVKSIANAAQVTHSSNPNALFIAPAIAFD